MSGTVIPSFIFCPKCGSRFRLREDKSEATSQVLKKQGYKALGRGTCPCGVVAVLCVQELPASPTFTLMFNLYKVEEVKTVA